MQLTYRQLTAIRGRKNPPFPIRITHRKGNRLCCWLNAKWEVGMTSGGKIYLPCRFHLARSSPAFVNFFTRFFSTR